MNEQARGCVEERKKQRCLQWWSLGTGYHPKIDILFLELASNPPDHPLFLYFVRWGVTTALLLASTPTSA